MLQHYTSCLVVGTWTTSVQVVPLPYPLQMSIMPLTYPLRVPLTLKAWEGLSVRVSY